MPESEKDQNLGTRLTVALFDNDPPTGTPLYEGEHDPMHKNALDTWTLDSGGWPLIINDSDGNIVATIDCNRMHHCSESDAVANARHIVAIHNAQAHN